MRLLRALAFGLLVAGGAYCLGFVIVRMGHELYPWAAPVFDALLPGWVAVALAVGGLYGFLSRNTRLRSLVLAVTFVVTLTGFYTMAVKIVDEHHDAAYRQQQERWETFVKIIRRTAHENGRCKEILPHERFAMTHQVTPSSYRHASIVSF